MQKYVLTKVYRRTNYWAYYVGALVDSAWRSGPYEATNIFVHSPVEPQKYCSSLANKMGGGPRVPYPKHVWSPAGGWYAQPANWKKNTAVAVAVIFSITAMAFSLSAEREYRAKMPEPGRFFPSRYWSKQIREHEAKQKVESEKSKSS
ncbi:hypothetical protein GGS21DRAFT_493654 [Xylaria nigripes]|nr:hypothetical protein GGS21DRAFT_493654 [Xylaria nigripes]